MSDTVFCLFDHFFFFFNDTATTEIYTLSLHDALPICFILNALRQHDWYSNSDFDVRDRKSTRLNSSPLAYLVCRLLLEKKKKNTIREITYLKWRAPNATSAELASY